MARKKKTVTEEEIVYSKQGENIEIESCPKCNEELVIQMKDGTEVLKCKGCKFIKHKKKAKQKKTEEKEEKKSEEFPDVELGFDPFAQQT